MTKQNFCTHDTLLGVTTNRDCCLWIVVYVHVDAHLCKHRLISGSQGLVYCAVAPQKDLLGWHAWGCDYADRLAQSNLGAFRLNGQVWWYSIMYLLLKNQQWWCPVTGYNQFIHGIICCKLPIYVIHGHIVTFVQIHIIATMCVWWNFHNTHNNAYMYILWYGCVFLADLEAEMGDRDLSKGVYLQQNWDAGSEEGRLGGWSGLVAARKDPRRADEAAAQSERHSSNG